MTDDFEIRWDRLFKTPSDLEQKKHLDKAILEREKEELRCYK